MQHFCILFCIFVLTMSCFI